MESVVVKVVHPSIQVDPRLTQYTGAQSKYYYLPLHSTTHYQKEVEEILGASNKVERSLVEIRSSIIKAKKAFYSHVKLPVDRVDDELLGLTIKEAQSLKLGVVLQVCLSKLNEAEFVSYLKRFSKDFSIEFILDGYSSSLPVIELTQYFKDHHFTLPLYKNLDWKKILSKEILKLTQEIHLYFSYPLQMDSPYLSCQESHNIFGLLKKYFPQIRFLPPKAVDIWDHRAKPDFDMEPYILPCFESQSQNPNIKYSVIIPTYNNQNHLRVTLRHLFVQDVGLDQMEIIVVDDGGTDQTQELVMELLKQSNKDVNFKYIFFPRPRKRVMGDSQYRAGISRNLGVKNAIGEILCFLDSDIVTPKDYLSKVGNELKNWDAIQAKRINLTQAASRLDCDYYGVDPKKDLAPDEAYWQQFIENTQAWHEMPFNWKYVCTHSFSIKRELFWELGGLKRNFIFYGFEDTDLGYRIVKRGYKLHLLDTKVYHLFHENVRSEFMNLKSLRHNLLSRTAQIFYLHHLDEDIYSNLLPYMEPEPTFKRFLWNLWKLMSLQFLWKAKVPVFKTFHPTVKELRA